MSGKLYVVRWLHDYYYLERAFHGGLPVCPPAPRLTRAFADAVAAEKFRQQLERGAKPPPPAANPFHGFRQRFLEDREFHGLADLTSMPEPIFLDWLREAGLEPPDARPHGRTRERDWAGWWDQHSPRMTDLQRAKVWQALDRLRFYEIVETELED